ncbi:WSC domain-containing protein [Hirsutella rhossiliensis]|uniref:WSC domain-containing protein n=1 Tax=Hirsutella rhossiliensis TaxID=111463 RepID=A0A9P8N7N0_9HYPO|nr:WSC domain-containing protein [Hirsutella rhossiliensis]KAH0968047.1 WSC domain-containing protein [Hirsutella rhossiliensis]
MMKSVVALSAGFVAGANAFWRMECPGRVGIARMDPIVNPGEMSSHVHSIHGSSGFYGNATCPDLLAGECTSCRVKQDMSSYWHPALYFKHESGEYELVEQVGGMLAYYLLYGDDIKAFPHGFRMLSGDTERLGFNCLNYGKTPEGTLARHFLPDKAYLDANCKDGIRFEIMFPSCWKGHGAIDSDNHMDHVAFPDLVMSGTCPESHPIRLPSLLYEVIWNTGGFKDKKGKFLLSNGDETGYGYHGDFMMGWDEDFLQKAVNTCTNDSGRIEDCPLFDIMTKDEADKCSMEKPLPQELRDENVKGPMPKLPGGGGKGHGSGKTPVPTKKYSPGEKPAKPASPLPGQIFKEKSRGPAPAATDTAKNEAVVVPEAEPTPAAAAPEPEDKKCYSTQYVTHGNVVSKILLEAQTVYATEYVESTKTVTARATDAAHYRRHRAAHLHAHGHRKRKL